LLPGDDYTMGLIVDTRLSLLTKKSLAGCKKSKNENFDGSYQDMSLIDQVLVFGLPDKRLKKKP